MSGLQHLINFILNEVALSGDQGAKLSDILYNIDEFYRIQPQDVNLPKQNIDHRFKAKVWSWLSNNPEVSVGRKNEWNHLTLDEAEHLSLDPTDGARDSSEQDFDIKPILSPIRVFVSRERTWLAVAGHPPDDSKVVPLEFALLSIIASCKSKGIAQPDLVKLSGQDKRSVPKRTDALQKKGYIEKRPIQTKSARTSLCTLQRFLGQGNSQESGQLGGDEAQSAAMIDFDSFNAKLFDIIRENRIIAREDLKRKLGFKDKWRWRVLSRAVRKWERIGVLKRVRAESQYEKLHPCVKLEREPTATDFELFHEFDFEVLIKHGVEKAGSAIPVGLDQGDLEPPLKSSPDPEESEIDLIKEQVELPRRIVPSWTPDRHLNNQMFDIINSTGTKGITNMELLRICFGKFFKRPAEILVHRLVDFWQLAQPLHLRHFAVVRDMAMVKTVMFYVHYSADNFAKIVDAGNASWEAVEFPAKKAKSLKLNLPPYGAVPQLDVYGFPVNVLPRNLLKNPDASLRDGIMAAKPADYTISSSDPFVVQLPDGQYVVQRRQDKFPTGTRHTQIRHKPRSSQTTPSKRPRGSEDAGEPSQKESKDLPVAPTPTRADHHEWQEAEEIPPPKRAKKRHEGLRGLSRKEKFEALGMDENWTEYNALLMEKPTPGIYVTPHGRRRPAGKARGRPRQSRIAVFKSPKLESFSWFVKDEDDSDNDSPEKGALVSSQVCHPPGTSHTPATVSSAKRPRPEKDSVGPSSPSPASYPQAVAIESPHKKPRLDNTTKKRGQENLHVTNEPEFEVTVPATQESSMEVSTPRHRDTSLGIHHLEDEQVPTPSKRRRTGLSSSPHPVGIPGTPSNPGGYYEEAKSSVPSRIKPQVPTLSRRIPRGLRGRDLTADEQKLLSAPKPLIGRGGSINLLRRKVLMEIMDKAGGAYPGGAVIWYPFVTLWMKKGNKEKPDMKTVQNACRQLVDTGHLRQLTFSGRNNKGLTVTKTLLIKPDMSPDHPVVKEMQKKFLAMDSHEPRPGFCENVEIDRLLTRSSGRPHGDPPRRQRFSFPVEKGAHFNLQQKPASIVNEETRRTNRIQREFLKSLEAEARIEARIEATEQEELALPGVRRLMTLSRPPVLDTRAIPQTSIMRPYIPAEKREPPKLRTPIIRADRTRKTTSATGLYAMLMKPPQHFHLASGTFSTGSCSLKTRKSRYTQPIVNAEKSVTELHKLAQEGEVSLEDSNAPEDGPNAIFNTKVDKILRWELDHEGAFQRNLEGQEYIDQTIPGDFETAPIHGNIRFMDDQHPPSKTPAKSSTAKPTTKRSEALRNRQYVLEPAIASTVATNANTEPPKRKSKQRRALHSNVDRRLAKLDGASTAATSTSVTVTATASPEKQAESTPRQRSRRLRSVRSLPEELIRNLMVAIVAVRVLAGGTESRVIDWHLVAKAFPDQESSFIIGRARQVLSKNRLQMAKMHRDFQERFLEAYEKDEVPRINYFDLQSYDWPAILDWGRTQLDFSPSERVPDLPATRQQFDSVFELREEPLTARDELFQAVHGVTINKKRSLMAHNPFSIPLEKDPSPKLSKRKAELTLLENAKSWVRANVITPEKTYQPNEANGILKRFGEPMLKRATQILLNERVISSTNRGRLTPGRNYDISDNFLQILSRKRGIDSVQLRQASDFKSNILDPELQKTGTTHLKYSAEDGDVLALINLFATGHIQLQPQDAPRDKFGFTSGSYLTRQIDKKMFRFPVHIISTEKYVYGDPIRDKAAALAIMPAPSSSGPGLPHQTPLWYDVNGDLEPNLWKMVMGPILGCLVTCPGLNAHLLAGMIKPIMGAWEILKILQWMAEVGIVKADGEGETASWKLQQSWWMVPA